MITCMFEQKNDCSLNWTFVKDDDESNCTVVGDESVNTSITQKSDSISMVIKS